MPHPNRFKFADENAVQVLLGKLHMWSSHQQRRERLLKALGKAADCYRRSKQKESQAFFHGLLTGYAVALKLW